jgi:putative phage-type endonuclease
MTTAIDTGPLGVIPATADRHTWLAGRRRGLGASDVAAALGFIRWKTQWQVWAEKVNARRPEDQPSAAAELGLSLEPWLIEQASALLGLPVVRTPYQLYAHPDEPWQMASPDAWVDADHLVELKTAGIASGWGIPDGWTEDSAPLGYEIQCRWQMRILNAGRVDLVALVAGLGLRRYTYTRDLGIEADLVAQAGAWWQRYVVARVEPPVAARDNDILSRLYPAPTAAVLDLDRTDAIEHAIAYRRALAEEKRAAEAKETAAAALKALLGPHAVGHIDGHVLCTWNAKKGAVDWSRLAHDLAERHQIDLPDVETYRRPDSRVLSVKELTS